MSFTDVTIDEVEAVAGAKLASAAPSEASPGLSAYAFRQASPCVDAAFSASAYDVLEVTLAGWQRYAAAANGGRPQSCQPLAGDCTLYPAGTSIAVQGQSDADVVFVTLAPEVLRQAREGVRGSSAAPEPLRVARSAPLMRLALRVLALPDALQLHGPAFRETLQLDIGHAVLRDLGGAEVDPDATGQLAPKALRRVLDYLRANLGADCSVADLARVAGLSRYHFLRSFRAATGQSPHQMLLAMRLADARWRLSRSSGDLAGVAYALGFNSQAHFTSTFTRLLGISPGKYRALFRRKVFA